MRTVKLGLPAAAVLVCLGAAISAGPAPAQAPMPRDKPTTSSDRPDASAARWATLDPVRLIADQMRLEKNGNMTGLLSKGFKAAYDAVPRDEDNLGPTILGFGYDVPDRVVRVSGLRYEDAANPVKASATATLHYTNEDALVPSFNRSIVVAFVEEGGRWRIDDVRPVDPKGRRMGREFGLKRAFERLAEERVRSAVERPGPATASRSASR